MTDTTTTDPTPDLLDLQNRVWELTQRLEDLAATVAHLIERRPS